MSGDACVWGPEENVTYPSLSLSTYSLGTGSLAEPRVPGFSARLTASKPQNSLFPLAIPSLQLLYICKAIVLARSGHCGDHHMV